MCPHSDIAVTGWCAVLFGLHAGVAVLFKGRFCQRGEASFIGGWLSDTLRGRVAASLIAIGS
ncbi:hypothetical protein CCHOA_09885 [Corynebacterium choanae]|uniref:Uncharacterized protein n=1 Tax=Corynebacterium choanae TaxID=1862358 RepID=A0A3G6JCG5_9CORY|nr:hypothetical protein CCHOA_09885 [Corynebacterium choanae]